MDVEKCKVLGGWLLVFVILSCLAVVMLIVNGVGAINDARLMLTDDMDYQILVFYILIFIELAVNLAFLVIIIYAISNKKDYLLFVLDLWLLQALILPLIPVLFLYVSGYNNETTPGEWASQYLINVGRTFLWTMYFRKSVRVRIYMLSDAYLKRSIFSRNSQDPVVKLMAAQEEQKD